VFWIAFAAGAVQLAANYFYYDTLKLGEASQMLAIMGGFSPLFTYLIAIGLLREPLGRASIPGFALMVAGGFVMFFSERLDVKRILALTLMAAATFGLSSVLQKMAFEATNFVSGYVAFTFGTFAAAVFLLIRRTWRDQIFRTSEESSSRSRQMYFLNRFVNGVASFLIFVAISRASPAVVDAISGLRFVVIFAGAYLIGRYHPVWLKEQYGGWTLAGKLIGTALVVSGLVLVGLSGESDSI
jgi:drug/metabolite transporter (DMT)-like permease